MRHRFERNDLGGRRRRRAQQHVVVGRLALALGLALHARLEIRAARLVGGAAFGGGGDRLRLGRVGDEGGGARGKVARARQHASDRRDRLARHALLDQLEARQLVARHASHVKHDRLDRHRVLVDELEVLERELEARGNVGGATVRLRGVVARAGKERGIVEQTLRAREQRAEGRV